LPVTTDLASAVLFTVQREMPSADAILAGLVETANAWRSLAIAWHLLLAGLLVACLAGSRLATRAIAMMAVASVLSVSAISWVSGNPFTGTMFAALALTLGAAATRIPPVGIQVDTSRRGLTGVALVVFGWTYPHFVSTDSWIEYAYAAPFGLIPCPTLSVVIGLTLLVRNLGTAAWMVPLIVVGAFYGIVGVFALNVVLDVPLLAGALVLAVAAAVDSGGFRSVSHSWRVSHREGRAP
jgi:hypothetical protein